MSQDLGALDTFWSGPVGSPFTLYPRMLTYAPTTHPTRAPTMAPTQRPTHMPTMLPTSTYTQIHKTSAVW